MLTNTFGQIREVQPQIGFDIIFDDIQSQFGQFRVVVESHVGVAQQTNFLLTLHLLLSVRRVLQS